MANESDELAIVPPEIIERRIYLIRGHKVMLDSGLAELYGVPAKRLNEQVKRNKSRFPGGLLLPTHEGRGSKSEVANCDLKNRPRRTTVPAIRVHRAGCRDALLRAFKPSAPCR